MGIGEVKHGARFLIQHVWLDTLARKGGHLCLPRPQLLVSGVFLFSCHLQLLALLSLDLEPIFSMNGIPHEIIRKCQKHRRRQYSTETDFYRAKQI